MTRRRQRSPQRSERSQPNLVVRRARPEDREAILAMSRGIWGGTDYLPLVWDRWLADDKGLLLTATLDGRPVGMSKITILSPGEVWLEGLRLHPDLHGRGLTRQINRVAFREVMNLHPKSVRYSTGAGNAVSRHLGERRGFWQIARAHWLWGAAAKRAPLRGRVAKPAEQSEIVDFVRNSECYHSMSGLYAIGWKFPALTRRRLRGLLSRGRVLVTPRRGRIRGVALYDIGEIDGDICLGYVDGPKEAITSLARDVLRVAASTGHDAASAMLPVGRIANTVRAAGFDRIRPVDAVVYELGARGFRDDDEPFDSIMWRTLRMHGEEATDLVADFLTERAPRGVERQNVRDFVARNIVPDHEREVIGSLQPLQHRLASWSLRGVLRGVVKHLIVRHGFGRDSIRIRKGGLSFWHGEAKIADLVLARRSIRITLGPGFGPCFPRRLGSGREWITFDETSFDRRSGRYAAVTMRLTEESQVGAAIEAVDIVCRKALRPRGR